MRELREFAQGHMKGSQVKIGTSLNRFILRDSVSSPPRSVKVRAVKDEEGLVWLDLFGARPEEREEPKPKPAGKPEEQKEKAEREAQKKPLSEAERKAEKEAMKAEMKK